MLFREEENRVLAISQPAHAWISGQLLRRWDDDLPEALLFGAEQHDIAWLEWEAAPTFNPDTRRPHGFREIGPAIYAPLWRRGVETALSSYGRHVALLVSRHGSGVYRRFARPAPGSADAAAVEAYFADHGALQAEWMAALQIDERAAAWQSGLIAFVDALSLALCGDLRTPLELQAPTKDGGARKFHLTMEAGYAFQLEPWPFRGEKLVFEGEALRLPQGRRFESESAFRNYLRAPAREAFRSTLRRG